MEACGALAILKTSDSTFYNLFLSRLQLFDRSGLPSHGSGYYGGGGSSGRLRPGGLWVQCPTNSYDQKRWVGLRRRYHRIGLEQLLLISRGRCPRRRWNVLPRFVGWCELLDGRV